MQSCENKIEKLQTLPIEDWPKLCELYKADWPKHIISYYTIRNFINWTTKNTQIDDVRILTIGDWRQHGTYILENRSKIRYNIYFNTLASRTEEIMLEALNCLDTKPAYTLAGYVERSRFTVIEHLKTLGLSIDESYKGYCPALLYYLPKEESIKLISKPINGFVIKPLTEKYIEQINDSWPHKYPGSDYLIQRIVRFNHTIGVFDTITGVLCGWVMEQEYGTIGNLHVEPKYQRRGLGMSLVRLLCIEMAKAGLDATTAIMVTNTASRSLFEKIGFKVIDKVYWYDKVAFE
ncbi:uncharacterized protein LOC119662191 [Teleopsis dalmanni]|uniref:uncharacterized protein LOC119662191 n=1 Tax=Teleopsis dalmanni TaxID=139649 RepID=UPI000D329677|nr:uncharacterized protein LOC119662191 [Teleopsis dalmanni]